MILRHNYIIKQELSFLFMNKIFVFPDDIIRRFECDKIVGGRTARKGQFPWMVGLWRINSTRPFCGGSLVGER